MQPISHSSHSSSHSTTSPSSKLSPRSPITPRRPARPTSKEVLETNYFDLSNLIELGIIDGNVDSIRILGKDRVVPPKWFSHKSTIDLNEGQLKTTNLSSQPKRLPPKSPHLVSNKATSSTNLLQTPTPMDQNQVHFTTTSHIASGRSPYTYSQREKKSPDSYWSPGNLYYRDVVRTWIDKDEVRNSTSSLKWKLIYMLYLLMILIFVALIFFLDFNIIYILTQLILYPLLPKSSTPAIGYFFSVQIPIIHTSTAWLVALIIYCLAILVEAMVLLVRLGRFLKVFKENGDHGKVDLELVYSSDSNLSLLALRSWKWFELLVRLRIYSNELGLRDFLIQSLNWYCQNWIQIFLRFRAIIAFIILILFSGQIYGSPTNISGQKDSSYFIQDGTLSLFAVIVLLISCSYTLLQIFILLFALAARTILTIGSSSISLSANSPSSLSSESLELRSLTWKDRRSELISRWLAKRTGNETPLFGCSDSGEKQRKKSKRSLNTIYWGSPISNLNSPYPTSMKKLPTPLSVMSSPHIPYRGEVLQPSSPIDLSVLSFPSIGPKKLPKSAFSSYGGSSPNSPATNAKVINRFIDSPTLPIPSPVLDPISPSQFRDSTASTTQAEFSQESYQDPKLMRQKLFDVTSPVIPTSPVHANLLELHGIISEMSSRINSVCSIATKEEELNESDIYDDYFEEDGTITPRTYRGLGIDSRRGSAVEATMSRRGSTVEGINSRRGSLATGVVIHEGTAISRRGSELRFSAGTFGSI